MSDELDREPPEVPKSILPDVPDWDPLQESETLRKRSTVQRETETKSVVKASSPKGLVAGLVIAYALIGSMVVGFLIGMLVDRGSGSGTGRAIGTMIGLGVGIGLAIWIAGYYDKAKEGK